MINDILKLKEGDLNNIDLSIFDHFVSEYYKPYFYLNSGEEHYRLLAKISTFFDKTTLLDIGTHHGCSALALSYNKTNIVNSWDIIDSDEERKLKIKLSYPESNIRFNIGNVLDLVDFHSFPFIFVDVDHSGLFESKLIDIFLEENYKGCVIFDDIYLNQNMKAFWNEKCKGLNKHDITHLGHWSGTGVIFFE